MKEFALVLGMWTYTGEEWVLSKTRCVERRVSSGTV